MKERTKKRLTRSLIGLAAVAGFVGVNVWYSLFRTEEAQAGPQTPRDAFVYGSLATEGEQGTPYWLWLVLPKVFPEYLPGPGGYASIGLTWEEGHDLPMGVTRKFIGFERVGINCAFCHVAQVRLTPDDPKPTIYPAAPGHQVRSQDYQNFMFRSAADPRFRASTIMPEIRAITKLSAREDALYSDLLIPMARRALLEQRDLFAWQGKRPHQGPGRVDPFNPMRFNYFKEADDGNVGNADIPSIWNQQARVGKSLHWNGLTWKFMETAISSAIGDGALKRSLDPAMLDRVWTYLSTLPAPKYPLGVDAALAAAGKPVFDKECASCHAQGAERAQTLIPVAEVGTDPNRSRQWDDRQVADWKGLAAEYQRDYGATWNLETFNHRDGYLAMLLDGIWLRGPYLHNGSVPSLRALLDPPEKRPRQFYRGNDVLDRDGVGFVSDQAERRGKKFFLYDTSETGNGNAGHAYGTTLSTEDKGALLEYLKTL